ncbi:MAG: type II toxin-antitoxin system PemK/MazF family toxin [Chloroflexota bacterium]
MTDYKPGDVVLVPYPLGQASSPKKRPALVISPEAYNQATGELIMAQITSRVSAPPRPGDYRIQDWQEAKLPRPALVRARLATLKAAQVLRKLGELKEGDLAGVQEALRGVICQ